MDNLLRLTPGVGVLFVRLPFSGDSTVASFVRGVIEGMPVLSSYYRSSPFVAGSRGKNKLMGIIGHEVAQAMDGYCKCIDSRAKRPVVNRKYMADFYRRMNIDEDCLIAGLGVADQMTRICLGKTSRGGKMLFISTAEEQNHAMLEQAWKDKETSLSLQGTDYIRFVQDVAVLTALAKANRLVMYYQISLAAEWPRKMSVKSYPTTIYSGLDTSRMDFYHKGICVPDNAMFCVQDTFSENLFVMQAPKGDENKVFPPYHSAEFPPLPFNRVTIESLASVNVDHWSFSMSGLLSPSI